MSASGHIKPTDRAIKAYYATLQAYADQQVVHEGAVETAFQKLLTDTARAHGWMLVPKLPVIADLHLCASVDGHQCFPFYFYDEDGTNRRENITDWALEKFRTRYKDKKIGKWDIFHYVYGILHHPGYRTKFADNLKRELPRIPLAPDFKSFRQAGQELAQLHLEYEQSPEYPLPWRETDGVPLSYHVDRMKLTKDKSAVIVNPSLTLGGIPPETFEYRLGNRSALDWIIDQYQVSEDKKTGIRSDPNRPDDPEYIVRLIGQVLRVSVETVKIVYSLPKDFSAG